MMPAAPLVGAVTTRPPAAFSSLTARAYSVTQSIARSGSSPSRSQVSCRNSRGARRGTFSPPGSIPSVAQPRSTQARMTCHRSPRSARTCPAVRPSACSLASTMPETGSPLALVWASNSSPVVNG